MHTAATNLANMLHKLDYHLNLQQDLNYFWIFPNDYCHYDRYVSIRCVDLLHSFDK
jgi:hypothetical protein